MDASLQDGASSGAGADTLAAFEDIWGSDYDDVLEGDDGNNVLSGRLGNNLLFGLAGDDYLYESSPESDAGPGFDSCEDQKGRNCETWSHADEPSSSRVVFPEQAKTYDRDDVTEVRAIRLNAASLSPPVERILLALRVITEDGCLWWSQQRSSFVWRSCGLPLFNERIEIDRPLRAGPYRAYSLAILEDSGMRVGPTHIDFSVVSL